jgi:hypothetical protein
MMEGVDDLVRPLGTLEYARMRSIGTIYGFGSRIVGRTPRGTDGLQFGTLWVFAFGLPIYPRCRLLFSTGESEESVEGVVVVQHTDYHVAGATPLVPIELVKTCVYRWLLVPLVLLGPVVLYLAATDAIADVLGTSLPAIMLFVALPLGWLLGGAFLIDGLHRRYVDGDLRLPWRRSAG